jgi:hypothetical protein
MPKSRKRQRGRHSHRKPRISPLAVDRMFDRAVRAYTRQEAPEVLYHYTSWSGLEGILRSQRFWATAHDCTNDEAELKSADEVILEVARGLRRTAKGTAALVLDLFLDGYPKLQMTHLSTVYLCCFSVARDLEEQWRRYGDDGNGFCVGIRVLEEAGPVEHQRGTAIVKVEYSESSWRENVAEAFRQTCRVLERLPARKEVLELGLFAFYRSAAFTSMSAKREGWAVEQEYRRVTLVHRDANIVPCERVSKRKTIRYLPTVVRANGKRIALAEIIIGPNQDFSPCAERVRELLAATGYAVGAMEYPEINHSGIAPWGLSSVTSSSQSNATE